MTEIEEQKENDTPRESEDNNRSQHSKNSQSQSQKQWEKIIDENSQQDNILDKQLDTEAKPLSLDFNNHHLGKENDSQNNYLDQQIQDTEKSSVAKTTSSGRHKQPQLRPVSVSKKEMASKLTEQTMGK